MTHLGFIKNVTSSLSKCALQNLTILCTIHSVQQGGGQAHSLTEIHPLVVVTGRRHTNTGDDSMIELTIVLQVAGSIVPVSLVQVAVENAAAIKDLAAAAYLLSKANKIFRKKT